ncbi:MAG: hypothetical protein VZR00_01660 [Lachnospiraceae bacterium]|jgi:hypothetical protein|nr:hypothetical protein [Lachnospiraceae bacterium]MEE3460582.1 hypothetical protein [Lachnospiraceae bacterium]
MSNTSVYADALVTSLNEKAAVMKQIYDVSVSQKRLLMVDEFDMDKFEKSVSRKDDLILQVRKLDQGFDDIYSKAGPDIKEHKQIYKKQILKMQTAITNISDFAMKIEKLEKELKKLFETRIAAERKEISDRKKSVATAGKYYQNMANQHQEWQSYFMDQKQ